MIPCSSSGSALTLTISTNSSLVVGRIAVAVRVAARIVRVGEVLGDVEVAAVGRPCGLSRQGIVAVGQRAGRGSCEQQRGGAAVVPLLALLHLRPRVGAGEQRVLAGDGAGGDRRRRALGRLLSRLQSPDRDRPVESGVVAASLAVAGEEEAELRGDGLGVAAVADGRTEADRASDRDAAGRRGEGGDDQVRLRRLPGGGGSGEDERDEEEQDERHWRQTTLLSCPLRPMPARSASASSARGSATSPASGTCSRPRSTSPA